MKFHMPTIVTVALLSAFLWGSGFAIGRWATPATVEKHNSHTVTEKEKVENTYVQKMDMQELKKTIFEMVQKIVAETSKKNNVLVQKTKTTKPNGEVVEEETTKDLSESSSKSTTDTSSKTQQDVLTRASFLEELKLLKESLKVDHTESSEKTTNHTEPQYRFAVNVGYDFGSFLGAGAGFNLVPVPGLVVQLQAERKLFLNINGVIWVQSTGVAGLGASIGM